MNESTAIHYFDADLDDVDLINDLAAFVVTGKDGPRLYGHRERLTRLLQRILLDYGALRAYCRLLLNRHLDLQQLPAASDTKDEQIDSLVLKNRFELIPDDELIALATDPARLSILFDELVESQAQSENEGWTELAAEQGDKDLKRLKMPDAREMLRRAGMLDEPDATLESAGNLCLVKSGSGHRREASRGQSTSIDEAWHTIAIGPFGTRMDWPVALLTRCSAPGVTPVLEIRPLKATEDASRVAVQLAVSPAPEKDGFGLTIQFKAGQRVNVVMHKGREESAVSEAFAADVWKSGIEKIEFR